MFKERFLSPARRLAALSLLLLPALAWASGGFAVFGRPPSDPGIPLSCADPNKAIQQWNSGSGDRGMQSASIWDFAEWQQSANLNESKLPIDNVYAQGWVAPLVTDQKNPNWADPPAGSNWVYAPWYSELNPLPAEDAQVAYMVAIWIPTAEDAARMRVTMTYRAEDELIAIVRNELTNPNLLSGPITQDTFSRGTAPGTVQLNSGWRQGENHVLFVVRNTWNRASEAQNYLGFAASFTANCVNLEPQPVPTTGPLALGGLVLSLMAVGAYARRAGTSQPRPQRR